MSGIKQKSRLWGAAVLALAENQTLGHLPWKFVCEPAPFNHYALGDSGKNASA